MFQDWSELLLLVLKNEFYPMCPDQAEASLFLIERYITILLIQHSQTETTIVKCVLN